MAMVDVAVVVVVVAVVAVVVVAVDVVAGKAAGVLVLSLTLVWSRHNTSWYLFLSWFTFNLEIFK